MMFKQAISSLDVVQCTSELESDSQQLRWGVKEQIVCPAGIVQMKRWPQSKISTPNQRVKLTQIQQDKGRLIEETNQDERCLIV